VTLLEPHKSFANVTFLILSLEGPDPYSHAGGLGSRIDGLSKALSNMGFDTHYFLLVILIAEAMKLQMTAQCIFIAGVNGLVAIIPQAYMTAKKQS
jgi:hypothetical protein